MGSIVMTGEGGKNGSVGYRYTGTVGGMWRGDARRRWRRQPLHTQHGCSLSLLPAAAPRASLLLTCPPTAAG